MMDDRRAQLKEGHVFFAGEGQKLSVALKAHVRIVEIDLGCGVGVTRGLAGCGFVQGAP